MPHLELDLGSIYYQDIGSGAPILFINAGLGTHDEWVHQASSLSSRFHAITFDWLGTGASSIPNIRYTLNILVDQSEH